MSNNRKFFLGKKTYDIDMLLRQSDSYFFRRKFGKIDTTIQSTKQAIWNLDNTAHDYKFTNTARGVEYYICSPDATANQLVILTLLDTNGETKVVTMILNGQTVLPVRTAAGVPQKFTRHQTSSIVTLKTNPIAGNVYIFEGGAATNGIPDSLDTVRGYIANGENRTQQGIYTIPTDCYGFFIDIHLYFIKKQAAVSVFELQTSAPFGNNTPFDLTDWPANQVDPLLQATLTVSTTKPDARREFEQSPEIDPGTDLIFSQTADVAAAGVAIDFDLICIKKEFFGRAN